MQEKEEHRPPMVKIVLIILSVILLMSVIIGIVYPSIVTARKEAQQKAEEQAFIVDRQAFWAEFATRWNVYMGQEDAPTKGTEYPFQMAEGYQDAVAFGSGEVWIDLDANYYAPNILGDVTYRSSSGYSETDIDALLTIFAGEDHAVTLMKEFREYLEDNVEEGINFIRIILSNTTDGVFAPSLEFDYQYYEFLLPDDGLFGLRSNVTLKEFADDYNAYVCEQYSAEDLFIPLVGFEMDQFQYEGVDDCGYKTYLYNFSHSTPHSVSLRLSGDYIVSAIFAYDPVADAKADEKARINTLSDMLHVLASAMGTSYDTVADLIDSLDENNGQVFQRGLVLEAGIDDTEIAIYRISTVTESVWEKAKNGTLATSPTPSGEPISDPTELAFSYLENWSWEANNGDDTSATLLEILAYYFPDSSYTISESEELGTVTIEASDPGLAIVFSSDGGAPIIPSYSAVSQEEFSALCEDYMEVLRANH